jgi:hypothetical protein
MLSQLSGWFSSSRARVQRSCHRPDHLVVTIVMKRIFLSLPLEEALDRDDASRSFFPRDISEGFLAILQA